MRHTTKKPWTRTEQALLATPVVFMAVVGGALRWRSMLPVSLELSGATGLNALEFSPDGKKLLVFFNDSKTFANAGRVYDLETRSKKCDLVMPLRAMSPNPGFTTSNPNYSWPAWSPDGTRIVAGYNDYARGFTKIPTRSNLKNSPKFYFNEIGKIALWDAQSGQLKGNYLYAPPNEDSFSQGIRFSLDGNTLIGVGTPPSLFDSATGQRLKILNGTLPRAYLGRISKESGIIAVMSDDFSHLQVFDPKTKQVVWKLQTSSIDRFLWGGDVLGVTERGEKPQLVLWDAKTHSFARASSKAFRLHRQLGL